MGSGMKTQHKLVNAIHKLVEDIERVAKLAKELEDKDGDCKHCNIKYTLGRLGAHLETAKDSTGYAFWNACAVRDMLDLPEDDPASYKPNLHDV